MKFSTVKTAMLILSVGTGVVLAGNDVKADTMFSTTAVAGFSLSMEDIVTSEEATMIDDIAVEESGSDTQETNDEKIPSIYENIVLAKVKQYLNVRQKPDEDSEVVGKLYKGGAGTVIKTTDDGWTKIESGAVTGWVKNDYIVSGKQAETYANKVCNKKAIVKTETLRVREKASEDATIVTLVGNNEEFQVLKQQKDWVAIKIDEDLKGYVSAEYVEIDFDFDSAISIEEERLADAAAARALEEEAQRQREEQQRQEERQAQVREEQTQTVNQEKQQEQTQSEVKKEENTNTEKKESTSSASTSSGSRQKIVDYAVQFVGNPYVYGGTSLTNGTDCSGFTQSIYRHFGVSISRTSREQATNGRSVSLDQVQPGDLIFYKNGSSIGHVALYIGDGKVVHASSKRTGIKISNMYYRTPACARSVYH